jgi:hypothetical protein
MMIGGQVGRNTADGIGPNNEVGRITVSPGGFVELEYDSGRLRLGPGVIESKDICRKLERPRIPAPGQQQNPQPIDPTSGAEARG